MSIPITSRRLVLTALAAAFLASPLNALAQAARTYEKVANWAQLLDEAIWQA